MVSAGLQSLQNLTVGVAGATSFLSKPVVRALHADGAKVIPIIRRGSRVSQLPERLRNEPSLILTDNAVELADRISDAKIDIVINCIGNYGRMGETLTQIYDANVMAPLRIYEAAAASGCRLMVSIGTALAPDTNLYALSKNQLVDALAKASEASMRFCNVRSEIFYGPGDTDPKKLSSYLTNEIAQNAPSVALGSGKQKRDFLYVDDLADAIAHICRREVDRDSGFEEYDAGTGTLISVREFALLFKQVSGCDVAMKFGAIPDRHQSEKPVSIDVSKLTALGWGPKWSLENGIAATLSAAGVKVER